MNKLSLMATIVICCVLLSYRLWYSDLNNKPLKATTSDAFGYYMYLPKLLIYKDLELKWVKGIDAKYGGIVGGDWLYQAGKSDNGNYVCTYFSGVALMELPFFLMAHNTAKSLDFEADGFSPPYQYALVFGVLFYAFLGLFVLRKVLLQYFDDMTTALTLLLVVLASNLIQYVSRDSLQSHSFIFPLYCVVLFASMKWHEKPRLNYALLIGFTCGLATLCRPTEVIMFLIPLLWNTNSKENAAAKWQLVRDNKAHLMGAIIAGLSVLSLQFIYYKYVTGSFLHVTGSRWVFLNPFFRVLLGFEKGWFIYTPVTILFVLGLFKMHRFPFNKSIIWFSILNIWIIISWYDWQYGGSYSTRALSQSSPVFALSLAALIDLINKSKYRFLFYLLSIYLIAVNLFQLNQYSKTILHFKDMNRQYYSRIYLNPNPNPLDMSLLDTQNWIYTEGSYKNSLFVESDTLVHLDAKKSLTLFEIKQDSTITYDASFYKLNEHYLKVETDVLVNNGFWDSYILTEIISNKTVVGSTQIRLFNPIAKEGETNKYACYVKVPNNAWFFDLKVSIKTDNADFKGVSNHLKITNYWR